MNKKPKILGINHLAHSRLFELQAVDLRFANGQECQFERIMPRIPGAVMMVPFKDPETLLLVREYGAGMDAMCLTFPKGSVAKGEDKAATAQRELMEEVGYGSKSLTWLTQLSASPGYNGLLMDVYVARDLYPKKLPGDEVEPLEVVEWRLADIDSLLANPEFHEARSIAALFLALRSV